VKRGLKTAFVSKDAKRDSKGGNDGVGEKRGRRGGWRRIHRKGREKKSRVYNRSKGVIKKRNQKNIQEVRRVGLRRPKKRRTCSGKGGTPTKRRRTQKKVELKPEKERGEV